MTNGHLNVKVLACYLLNKTLKQPPLQNCDDGV